MRQRQVHSSRVLEFFHPETDEHIVTIRLTPEQAIALAVLLPEISGFQPLIAYLGEREDGP
jgi:hypothetical protein